MSRRRFVPDTRHSLGCRRRFRTCHRRAKRRKARTRTSRRPDNSRNDRERNLEICLSSLWTVEADYC